MASLFQAQSDVDAKAFASKIAHFDPSTAAPVLEPGGSAGASHIDVIRNYRWTGQNLSEHTADEIPYIILTEYRYLRTGAELLAQALLTNNTVNLIGGSNPYESLYNFDSPTGFSYTFPFYNTEYYDVANTFVESNAIGAAEDIGNAVGSAFSSIVGAAATMGGRAGAVGRGGQVVGAAAGAVGNVLSAGNSIAGAANKLRSIAGGTGKLDVPQIWDNTSPRVITFKFYLLNTYSVKDINDNWELIHLLRYQNVINKMTLVNAVPPVFYEVKIPGQHYSIASYISNLKIENVGTTRGLDDIGGVPGKVNIPDAFSVTITLTDFIKPSQNMLNTLITGQGGVSTIITNKAKSKEQGIMGGLMDKIGEKLSDKEKENTQGPATEAAPPSGNAPSAPDTPPAAQ